MPLVTVFNLRQEDCLSEIEQALRDALVSMPELRINDFEVDLVPVLFRSLQRASLKPLRVSRGAIEK